MYPTYNLKWSYDLFLALLMDMWWMQKRLKGRLVHIEMFSDGVAHGTRTRSLARVLRHDICQQTWFLMTTRVVIAAESHDEDMQVYRLRRQRPWRPWTRRRWQGLLADRDVSEGHLITWIHLIKSGKWRASDMFLHINNHLSSACQRPSNDAGLHSVLHHFPRWDLLCTALNTV